jgi:hypothetical protein
MRTTPITVPSPGPPDGSVSPWPGSTLGMDLTGPFECNQLHSEPRAATRIKVLGRTYRDESTVGTREGRD